MTLAAAAVAACAHGPIVESIKDPAHRFSRRPLVVVIDEDRGNSSEMNGIEAAMVAWLREMNVPARVVFNEYLSLHPTTLATLRLSDAGAYGLFVKLNRARIPNGMDVGELVYESTLYDQSDGKKVWRSLVDVGDLRGWFRDQQKVFCREMLARAKTDEVLR